tara:strand:+ start:2828 stop:6088 length:3261 start_codon:yes stop_codon:yes gene_type:complete
MYNYTNYIIYIIILLLIIYILYYIYIKNINIENFSSSQCNLEPNRILDQDNWFTKLKEDICDLYADQEVVKENNTYTKQQHKLFCSMKLLPNLIEEKDNNGATISQGLSSISNTLEISIKHIELLKYIINSKYSINCEVPAYPLTWIKINDDITNEPNQNLILLENNSIEDFIKSYFGNEEINIETQQEYDNFNIKDLRINHYIQFNDHNNNILKYKPKMSQIEYDYFIKLGNSDDEYVLNKETEDNLCLTNNYCNKNDDKCIKNSDKNQYILNNSLKFMRWTQSTDENLEYSIKAIKVISEELDKTKHDELVELARKYNFSKFDLSSLSQEKYNEYFDLFDDDKNKNKKIYIQLRDTKSPDPTKGIYYYEPKPIFYDTNYLGKYINEFNTNFIVSINEKLKEDDGTNANPCVIDKNASVSISQRNKFDLKEYLEDETLLKGNNFTKYGEIEEIKDNDNITGPPDERYSRLRTYIDYKNNIVDLKEDCEYYKSNVQDPQKNKLPTVGHFETMYNDNLVKWAKNTDIDLDNLTEDSKLHHIQNKHVITLQKNIDDEISNCRYTNDDVNSWNDTQKIDYITNDNSYKYGIIRDENADKSHTGGFINNETAMEEYMIEKEKCKSIKDSMSGIHDIIFSENGFYGRIDNTLTFDDNLTDEQILSSTHLHNSQYPFIENDYARKTINKVCFAESLTDNGIKIYGEIGNTEGKYGKIGDNCNQYIKSEKCSDKLQEINRKITNSLSEGSNKKLNKTWDNIENKELCYWNKIKELTNSEKNNLDQNYRSCLNNLLEAGYDNEIHDYTNPPIYNNELTKKTYIERSKFIWIEGFVENMGSKIDVSNIIPESIKKRIKNDIEETDEDNNGLLIGGFSKITEKQWKELLNNNHYKLSENDIENIYFIYNNKYYIPRNTDIYWKGIYNKYNSRYETKVLEQKNYLHSNYQDCSVPDNYLKDGEQCTTDNNMCLHKDNKTQTQLNNDITDIPNTEWYNNLLNEGSNYAKNNFKGIYYNTTLGPQCEQCTDINNTQPYNYIPQTEQNGYCNTDNTKICSDKDQETLNNNSSAAYDWMIDYENKCRSMNEISCIRQKDLL